MEPELLTSLREWVATFPYRPVFVTVSGAHQYGFPSPDSDVDLRGAHWRPWEKAAGLRPGAETVERTTAWQGRELDFVSHDLRKFLRLLASGENGYVLEQIYSPLVVIGGPALERLREIARGCVCRRLFRHYGGFFRHQWAVLEKEEPKRAKTLLYLYRVALTGLHVLRTGAVEANLIRLKEEYELPFLDGLMARKQAERSPLTEAEVEWHRAELARWEERLRAAWEHSPLPEAPTNGLELEAFLIDQHREEAGMLQHRFQIEVPTIPAGTQVVTKVRREAGESEEFIKAGAIGVVLTAPGRVDGLYRVRTPDGREADYRREELVIRKREVDHLLHQFQPPADELEAHIVYECLVGSRAYGLATEASDADRRGIYVAPPELLWSLWGAPEQIEDPEEDRVYWELGKFLSLALKANPNVLETLWTPLIERSSWISDGLRARREAFLSKQVFKTFGGYAISQFHKLSADVRQHGHYRPKHALHLIRLLLVGTHLLRTGDLLVDLAAYRDRLLPILDGHLTLEDLAAWRRELEADFNAAYEETELPDAPDIAQANEFLLQVRRWSMEQGR